jgi:hypothetical protein
MRLQGHVAYVDPLLSQAMNSASSFGSEVPCPTSQITASDAESQESSTVLGVHMPEGGWFSKCRCMLASKSLHLSELQGSVADFDLLQGLRRNDSI